MIQDSKQYWKRRALLAESQRDSIEKCRRVDHSMEMAMHAEISRLRVALAEIKSALSFSESNE